MPRGGTGRLVHSLCGARAFLPRGVRPSCVAARASHKGGDARLPLRGDCAAYKIPFELGSSKW